MGTEIAITPILNRSRPIEMVNGTESFTDFSEHFIRFLSEHSPLPDWAVSRVANDEHLLVHVLHQDLVSKRRPALMARLILQPHERRG